MHAHVMVLAKDIETALWNKAIDLLIAENWVVTYAYNGMDAGIDYDCVTLKKEVEEIKFEWTYVYEGEIRCTRERLKEIENLLGQPFKNIEAIEDQLPGSPQK